MKLVEVEWIDADFKCGWVLPEHIEMTPPPVRSVGYLVAKTREAVVLVSAYNEEDMTVCDVTRIPRGMVTTIRRLEVRK